MSSPPTIENKENSLRGGVGPVEAGGAYGTIEEGYLQRASVMSLLWNKKRSLRTINLLACIFMDEWSSAVTSSLTAGLHLVYSFSELFAHSSSFPDPNKVTSPMATATVPESHPLPLSPMKKESSDPPVVNNTVVSLQKELAQAKQVKDAAEERATTAENKLKDAMTAKKESDALLDDLHIEHTAKIVSLQGELAGAKEAQTAAEARATTALERATAAEARATTAEESVTAVEARATAAEARYATAVELLNNLKGGAAAHTLIVAAEERTAAANKRYATVAALLETAEAEWAARDAANA